MSKMATILEEGVTRKQAQQVDAPLTSSPGFLSSPPSPQDMAVLPLNLRVLTENKAWRESSELM